MTREHTTVVENTVSRYEQKLHHITTKVSEFMLLEEQKLTEITTKVDELMAMEKEMGQVTENLKQMKHKITDEMEQIQRMTKQWSSVVHLNVGGVKFSVALATLTKYEGSMLAAMFSGRFYMAKDEKGRVFIDRNGKAFSHVLDYLRNGDAWVPPKKGSAMSDVLKQEFAFYGLNPKTQTNTSNTDNCRSEWDPQRKSNNLELSNDRCTASVQKRGAAVRSKNPMEGNVKIRLNNMNGPVTIGVAPTGSNVSTFSTIWGWRTDGTSWSGYGSCKQNWVECEEGDILELELNKADKMLSIYHQRLDQRAEMPVPSGPVDLMSILMDASISIL